MVDKISNHDIKILKVLAVKVKERADLPVMDSRRKLWNSLNKLEAKRPMILCSPEGAWKEIITNKSLYCEGKLAREWENELLQQLFWCDNLKDDWIVEPYFDVPYSVDLGNYGVNTIDEHKSAKNGSYSCSVKLESLENLLPNIRRREFSVDRIKTSLLTEQANDIFRDILSVRNKGSYWWTAGLTWNAITLIGLENLMLFMYDEPDELHKLMAFLADDFNSMLDWFEKEDLLSLNNGGNLVGSGSIGVYDEIGKHNSKITCNDIWGLSESQETIGISPDMFGEFIFKNQLNIINRFGLAYYGCCEPVEKRWKYIKQIKNLRAVSVSPWSNIEQMAEILKKDYVYCRKVNPSPICVGFDEQVVREDIRKTIAAAKDCNLAIILKDTHTVENHPERLSRWVEIAREEIDAIY
ncbi:MAG TPA: hypothetical protein VIK78_03405 [Ruminiclostridium sp.]